MLYPIELWVRHCLFYALGPFWASPLDAPTPPFLSTEILAVFLASLGNTRLRLIVRALEILAYG
jgi:hypothetical protein